MNLSKGIIRPLYVRPEQQYKGVCYGIFNIDACAAK